MLTGVMYQMEANYLMKCFTLTKGLIQPAAIFLNRYNGFTKDKRACKRPS